MVKTLFFLLFVIAFHAQAEGPDEICDPKIPPVIDKLNKGLVQTELKKIAKSSNDNVIKYFQESSDTSCNTINYQFPEMTLKPGESVYFPVPSQYKKRGVQFMVLGHRQDTNKSSGGHDSSPGLSTVQVYSKGSWHYWGGPASGENGAKYAEPRGQPEIENLYDWDDKGHFNKKDNKFSRDPLLAEMMKVTSVGKDPVLLSRLTLKVDPIKETAHQNVIFSPGTAFTPQSKEKKYTLGGGQAFKGKFPGAKEISSGTELSIALTPGKKITTINVACGDTFPDEAVNKDGGRGTLGWAQISIGIKKANGQITWLMSKENVPPEGVLIASPKSCDEVVQKGDSLIIQGVGSTLYVMGIHIGYR